MGYDVSSYDFFRWINIYNIVIAVSVFILQFSSEIEAKVSLPVRLEKLWSTQQRQNSNYNPF